MTYIVKTGDTLSEIAERFGMTLGEISQLNGITNPDAIQVGQVLKVKGKPSGGEVKPPEHSGGEEQPPHQEIPTIITRKQMEYVGWYNMSDKVFKDLEACLNKYNITTKIRICHFISQCSHESVCGVYTKEIASGIDYEGRQDLGNIYPGDGPKFKGGGYIQLTGRANYTSFSKDIGDSEVVNIGVDYVANNYAWSSAGFWWGKNNMNGLCDANASVEDVTLRVNGGFNGLEDRRRYYQLCLEVF